MSAIIRDFALWGGHYPGLGPSGKAKARRKGMEPRDFALWGGRFPGLGPFGKAKDRREGMEPRDFARVCRAWHSSNG